jgi:hypothetical protein
VCVSVGMWVCGYVGMGLGMGLWLCERDAEHGMHGWSAGDQAISIKHDDVGRVWARQSSVGQAKHLGGTAVAGGWSRDRIGLDWGEGEGSEGEGGK